jgi:acetyl esterase
MKESQSVRSELNPQMAAAIENVRRNGLPEWHTMSVDRARRLEDELFTADSLPTIDGVYDYTIPGPADDIPVRIYRPDVIMPAPICVFYMVAGGYWEPSIQ